MAKVRKRISNALATSILYRCAKTCCVCKIPQKALQIHHIDENTENNVEENLVALCQDCHDEAHTNHRLSQNLTEERLIAFKNRWEEEIAERASEAMLPHSDGISQAMWTYVNHQWLPEIMRAKHVSFDPERFSLLRAENLIDEDGFPIFQTEPRGRVLATVYDHFDCADARHLHLMYIDAVDKLILNSNPIELGAIWKKSEMRSVLNPGALCFCIRGFRFKRIGRRENKEENRLAYAQSKGIRIEFLVNTRHMYGDSSLYLHFTGNSVVAVLMIVRNIVTENGLLLIQATPLAMGTGFSCSDYNSPYDLRYGWATGNTLPQNDGDAEED